MNNRAEEIIVFALGRVGGKGKNAVGMDKIADLLNKEDVRRLDSRDGRWTIHAVWELVTAGGTRTREEYFVAVTTGVEDPATRSLATSQKTAQAVQAVPSKQVTPDFKAPAKKKRQGTKTR